MSNSAVDSLVQQYFGDNAPPALSNVAFLHGMSGSTQAGLSAGARSGIAFNIAKNYIQNLSQSGDMQGYFQDASQTLANRYAQLIESNNDVSGVKQDIQGLVNGASSFGVDASALSNSINSTVGSNISDYNARQGNRDTGGGLGGFLDTVISVATNPATWVAVAAVIVAPELAPAIGAELGLTGTSAVAAGYGAIGAGTSAVTAAAQGANGTDIAKAALIGGAAGAAGGAITAEASGLVPELGKTGAAAVGGAAKGGIQAGLTGGSVGSSAAGGALGSALGTEIGGTTGNVLGGAAGSATGAQLAGGDPTKSAIYGGIQGAFSGLGKTMFNPQTGQQVAYDPQTMQLAQNQGTVTIGSPQVATDAPTGTDSFTPLPPGVMYNPDINQYTYADGRIYQPTLNEEPSNNLSLTGTSQYPTSTADYSGGGSKSNTLLGGPLGTQTTSPLSAGTLDVTGKQTSTIDQGGTTQKGQASPSDKPQLITPTIVPSSGGQSPQVLSSVLGAPSSSILGQALQSSNPDPATTGNPVFEGDGKNKRNVWNTESLRTALGLS